MRAKAELGACPLSWAQLTGQDETHVQAIPHGGADARMHPAAGRAFDRLRAEAREEVGCRIAAASAFRGHHRQMDIWNAKASGQAPLLDDRGRPLDAARLPAWERALALLRFSALPGASRHHWGSDVDVYDRLALPPGARLELTLAESKSRFAALHAWLDARIAAGRAHGFFRPYDRDRGGVAVEPWHLSWSPLSAACAQRVESAALRRCVAASQELALRETLLAHWDTVYARFAAPPERS